jgi:hypothetical protein
MFIPDSCWFHPCCYIIYANILEAEFKFMSCTVRCKLSECTKYFKAFA